MTSDPIVAYVEKQDWLEPIQEKGAALVQNAFKDAGEAGQAVKNALHGVWLGHPLHPAITDVPVGSWTAAAVLDVLEASGKTEYAAGADAAVVIGLIGALGSAAAGLADWSDTHGKPQRVGAAHGLLNIGATLLYGASYALRKSGSRGVARGLGWAGYGLVMTSAYLGGALSYNQKIGVNHSPDKSEDLPQDFAAVCAESDLVENTPTKVTVGDTPVMVIKQGSKIYAIANTCSHLGGPLNEGKIEGDTVVCPWHSSRFCLKDGRVLDGPATSPQPVLSVKVEGGQVLVKSETA